VQFRDDILRGVRLFLIIFAGVLSCVAVYRMMHGSGDVQGATPEETQAAPAAQPVTAADASSEPHGLVVPEPPPVPGEKPKVKAPPPVKHAASFDSTVPPPPAAVAAHVKRVAAPSPRAFETSAPIVLPAAPVEESSNTPPPTPQSKVGYKSLMEADTNRVSVEPAALPAAVQVTEQPEEKPKGNRFFKAVGKIFHPNGKSALQPQK
jgi:hypothetical protein